MNNSERGALSLFWMFFFLVLTACIPAGFAVWGWLKVNFVEEHAPTIAVLSKPDGLTEGASDLRLALADKGAGLDEIVVRYYRRGRGHELFRQSLAGAHQTELVIPLTSLEQDLPEGKLDLEIRVFDKSFYSNRAQERLKILLDSEKPFLEVVSTQHNSHFGGSQLVFYRVADKNLSVHGVQVGEMRFFGFKASEIDSDFKDPRLYVALYAIPLDVERNVKVRLFARDEAGNESVAGFYNKVLGRSFANYKRQFSDSKLSGLRKELGEKANSLSDREMLEQFLETKLSEASSKILEVTGKQELTRYWDEHFLKPAGSARADFGGRMGYLIGTGGEVSRILSGYELIAPANTDIRAVSGGKVVFTGELPVYGNTVGIDHGLGLFTFYGYLEEIFVEQGETLEAGDRLGSAGESGLADRRGLFFEVRVQGVPVDAREWWDRGWYHSHVIEKVNDVKKSLGIPYD